MPVQMNETRLPGVGVKYALPLAGGGRLSVILHNDGKRELYCFRPGDDEPRAVITLDDDEARGLGAVHRRRLRAAEDRRGARDGARRAADRVGARARHEPVHRQDARRAAGSARRPASR